MCLVWKTKKEQSFYLKSILDVICNTIFHSFIFSNYFLFQAGTKAPRQPWHDLHSRIDGPAAYDVLLNFEQRWRKATKWTEFGLRFKRVSHWHDDALIKIERISWILSPALPSSKSGSKEDSAQFVTKYGTVIPEDDRRLWVAGEDDPETWHVQVGQEKIFVLVKFLLFFSCSCLCS